MSDNDLRGPLGAESSTTERETATTDAEDQRKFRAWAEKLGLSHDELELFCREGFTYDKIPPKNTPARRSLIAYLKKQTLPLSKWEMISGLFPNAFFSESERRKRLRALYRVTTLLIKRALARQVEDAESDRSIYWDPIAEICRDLQIAQSKLSSLLKEYCGHSLSQLIDCVRAERIKALMRSKIAEFIREFRTQRASSGTEISIKDVWNGLQQSRRWPEFCRNTWAIDFGFASYRKMYRACLAVYKRTPHQIELSLIAEGLKEEQSSSQIDTLIEQVSWNLDEILAQLQTIHAYDDNC